MDREELERVMEGIRDRQARGVPHAYPLGEGGDKGALCFYATDLRTYLEAQLEGAKTIGTVRVRQAVEGMVLELIEDLFD